MSSAKFYPFRLGLNVFNHQQPINSDKPSRNQPPRRNLLVSSVNVNVTASLRIAQNNQSVYIGKYPLGRIQIGKSRWGVALESCEGFISSGIPRPEFSPEWYFALIRHLVARWVKHYSMTIHSEKRCLQTFLVCDVIETPQSRVATTTSRPPTQDIREIVNPGRESISDAH